MLNHTKEIQLVSWITSGQNFFLTQLVQTESIIKYHVIHWLKTILNNCPALYSFQWLTHNNQYVLKSIKHMNRNHLKPWKSSSSRVKQKDNVYQIVIIIFIIFNNVGIANVNFSWFSNKEKSQNQIVKTSQFFKIFQSQKVASQQNSSFINAF